MEGRLLELVKLRGRTTQNSIQLPHVKKNSSPNKKVKYFNTCFCLLVKLADTAFWLCTAELDCAFPTSRMSFTVFHGPRVLAASDEFDNAPSEHANFLGPSQDTVVDAGPTIIKQDWTLTVFVVSARPPSHILVKRQRRLWRLWQPRADNDAVSLQPIPTPDLVIYINNDLI